MKVLIVDDSKVMRKVIIGVLDRLGIVDVDQVADGTEGVDLVAKVDYDVVLMDWNMPKMLGIDAVRSIRAMGKKMPILMITTEAETERIIESVKAGAQDYIVKPFTPETLGKKLDETMKKAAAVD